MYRKAQRVYYSDQQDEPRSVKTVIVNPPDEDAEYFEDSHGDGLRMYTPAGEEGNTSIVGNYWKGRNDGNVVSEFGTSALHENTHLAIEAVAGESAAEKADYPIRKYIQQDAVYAPTFDDKKKIIEAKLDGATWEEVLEPYRTAFESGVLTKGEFEGVRKFVNSLKRKKRKNAKLEPPASAEESIPTVEYSPEKFPGLVWKSEKPKATVTLFENGKAVIVGPESERQGREIMKKFAETLQEKGFEVGTPRTSVQSVVMTTSLGNGFDLGEVERALQS